jgi:hypothetical protein
MKTTKLIVRHIFEHYHHSYYSWNIRETRKNLQYLYRKPGWSQDNQQLPHKASILQVLDWRVGNTLVTVANIVETEPSTVEELLGKISDTFEGIGKMKGVKVDLNIDTDVKPVAQPLRRIPFSVRPKIGEEVRRLLEEDIIEKIDKPTSWISPTVITPKTNPKEIRLNVDTRVANGAIPWENSITPTIEELIQELNGAQVFSHLDMNYGYL